MNHVELIAVVEEILGELHSSQAKKVQRLAQEIVPGLSAEDVLNPDDFPALVSNPHFTYEDGIAAGILSAKIALRARLRELSKA